MIIFYRYVKSGFLDKEFVYMIILELDNKEFFVISLMILYLNSRGVEF